VIGTKEVEQVVSVRKLVMGKGKGWITLQCLIQQANGLEQALVLRRAEQSSLDERLGPRVKVVGCEVLRRSFLDGGFLLRRKFTFELSDYLPSELAFDCEYIRHIAIVPLPPKLCICPCIDQLSADTYTVARTLDASRQHMRHAERLADLAQIMLSTDFVLQR
jgi:hypothetical protein